MPPVPNYFEFGVDRVGATLSTHATIYDAIIKSDNNVILQSGNNASAVFIKKTDNKVGISNSAPSEALDVTGFIEATSGYKTGDYGMVIDTSGNFTGVKGTLTGDLLVDNDTFFVDSTNNNVGIGTSSTDSNFKLHVKGNARIEGNITVNGTTTIVNTDVQNTERLDITNDGTGPAAIIKQTGAEQILKILDGDNICFLIEDDGHVLIGGAPDSDYQLDVSGNSHFINNVDISGNTDISGNLNVGGNADISGSLTCSSMNINGDFGVAGNFDLSQNFRILTDKFVIDSSGNVSTIGNVTVNTNKFIIESTTGNTDIAGTVDISGNVAVNTDKFMIEATTGNTDIAGTVDISGNVAINTNKFNIDATTGNTGIAGQLDLSKNLVINVDKFIVDHATGNTDIAGTVDISGNVAVNSDKFIIEATTGNTDIAGTVDISGNVAVNTNKFNIDATTGNTGIAGQLDLSKNLVINVDKFIVDHATGNTDIAGTVDISGNVAVNSDKFIIEAATGNTDIAGTVDISGNVAVNSDKFTVASSTGNTGIAGTVDISGNVAVNTDKFTVAASTGNTVIAGTLTLAGNLAIDTDVLFVDVSNNKVGINDSTPEFELDVSGNIATNNAIMFNTGTDGAFGHRSNNNGTDFALLQATTGKTTINCKAGSGNIEFKHGDGIVKQEFDSSGNVIIQGNLFSYSDARIKTNVETIPNALEKVISLRGVTYNMIKDVEIDPENAPKHIGVIAQEIEAVIPEAVKEENGIKTVAYGNIVGLLIEAIKDLKDQINK